MKKRYTHIIQCALVGTFLLLLTPIAIAQVGIGTITPDDDLDVIGDTQISGYLRIGDPATPQTITNTGDLLYSTGGTGAFNGFSQSGCAAASVGWTATTISVGDGGLVYDNNGIGHLNLNSPHLWIPSNATSVLIEIDHLSTISDPFNGDNYDGVYLEYSTNNGTTWNAIPLSLIHI